MNQLCPLGHILSWTCCWDVVSLRRFPVVRVCSEPLADDTGWVDEFGLTLPSPPHKPASLPGEVIAHSADDSSSGCLSGGEEPGSEGNDALLVIRLLLKAH